jgi:biotin synthase
MKTVENILQKKELTRDDLIYLLGTEDEKERQALFTHARNICIANCGNKVSLRGLIEITNQCRKNCKYCGIRAANKAVKRYFLGGTAVLQAAVYAWEQGFGSLVIQGGERQDATFTHRIADFVSEIKALSNNELGITLSCGEQSEAVYRQWKDAGAHRYLLRIESSNEGLYYKIHPKNEIHDFQTRLKALKTLQALGYQTGTGVMIGLPGQSLEHLADDLIFMKEFGIDMVGMGPYIPHPDTPMWAERNNIPDEATRLDLSLKMIALLRIMMKNINIAASTAMQTLDKNGRVKAIAAGANVFMPNLTPADKASNYSIYQGKPVFDDMAENALASFEENIHDIGFSINYNAWGDSKYYQDRIANN